MLALNNPKSALRFRRWSRKSYASFLTIGKHITIGRLKSIVADTLLSKTNKPNSPSNLNLLTGSFSEKEIDDPPLLSSVCPLTPFVFIEFLLQEEDIIALNITNSFSRLRVATQAPFSHFYFKNKKGFRKPKN
ncbi:MAG: hypothetical protein JSS64_11765 [Bacteroidetes bacterium]|nr:hypothetical protein [Bacteroidota bacterium]